MSSDDLFDYKSDIQNALGEENSKRYRELMRNWFEQTLSKNEFDQQARQLLPKRYHTLHNRFILAIFRKCQKLTDATSSIDEHISELCNQDFSSSTVCSPNDLMESNEQKDQKIFSPFINTVNQNCVISSIPEEPPNDEETSKRGRYNYTIDPSLSAPPLAVPNCSRSDLQLRWCAKSRCLPNAGTMFGRMFVGAWEVGVEGVSDGAVALMMCAVDQCLKNILAALFYHRKCKLTTPNSKLNPPTTKSKQLLNKMYAERPDLESVPCSIDEAEQLATYSAGMVKPCEKPISLYDLDEVLRSRRDLLPCHLVYQLNRERIHLNFYHSDEEL